MYIMWNKISKPKWIDNTWRPRAWIRLGLPTLHHDGSEHGINCGQWDCNFTTRGSKYNPSEFQVLTEHMEKKHGFKCNHYEDGFESQDQLNNHIQNDHSDSDDESESG